MRKLYLIFIGLFISFVGSAQTQIIEFTNTGQSTFTVPCGVTSITVEVWGAGGGGSFGAGGGGGGYAKRVIANPSGSYTVFVGSGGAAGGDGGTSYFESESNVSATGGKGATGTGIGNSSPGSGGAGLAGTTLFSGGNGGSLQRNGNSPNYNGGGGGGSAFTNANGNNGANATNNNGGAGGTGTGDGGRGGNKSGGLNALPGSNPGGGGGGRSSATGDADQAGANGKVVITYEGIRADYCIPQFSAGNDFNITYVGFQEISNSSPANTADVYEQFCDDVATVNQGGIYNITLNGNTGGDFQLYFRVFVDWNQDGDFDDPGESMDIGTINNQSGTGSNTEFTNKISVPAGALLGKTKMRVVMMYDAYGGACDNSTNTGQAEDYIIEVFPEASCQQPTSITASKPAVCYIADSPETITLTQHGGALRPDQQYHWYSQVFGGAWVSLGSGTNPSFDVTAPAVNTTYSVRIEGGDCGTDAARVTVPVTVSLPTTIALTSATGTDDQTVCSDVDGALANIEYTIEGPSTAESPVVTGLPAGVSGGWNTFANGKYVLSGKPSTAGTFNYTLTVNANTACPNPSVSGTITVLPRLTAISYYVNQDYCLGAQIQPLTATVGGGAANQFSISNGSLPTGLSLDPGTGAISGIPTAEGTYTFRITASNGTCDVESADVSITINTTTAVSQNLSALGSTDICSGNPGIQFQLDNSETNVSYQLFRDGSIKASDIMLGTGSPILFTSGGGGNTHFGTPGVYTARAVGGCGALMNGSYTINVTPKPSGNFQYSSNTYCQGDLTSEIPVLDATLPSTGIFSSTTGLKFFDNTTGEIDLMGSTPGTYDITYTVAAAGGCALYATTTYGITITQSVTTYTLSGGGDYCVGDPVPNVVLSGSTLGVTYDLYKVGGESNPVTSSNGTGNSLTFSGLAPGSYQVYAYETAGGGCGAQMNGTVTIDENPAVPAFTIAGISDPVCIATVVPLMAATGESSTVITKSVTYSNSNVSDAIANNNSTGISRALILNGVPNGAVIQEISVNFLITSNSNNNSSNGNIGRASDLIINLKGPNGNVINLANHRGGNSGAYGSGTGITFSNISTNPITTATTPYNLSDYSPEGAIGIVGASAVSGGNTSNVNSLVALYNQNQINGVWTLSVRDDVNPRTSYFRNWSITIKYTEPDPLSVNVTWTGSPDINDLYIDPAGALDPYRLHNDSRTMVYVNGSDAGTKTYTATATNQYGCSATAQKTITYKDGPKIELLPDYCVDIQNNFVVVTASADRFIDTWRWSGTPDEGPINTNDGNIHTSVIKTNTAGNFYVSASDNGCVATKNVGVGTELVTNGDFEGEFIDGVTNESTDYVYVSEKSSSALQPEGLYTVDTNPHDYHTNFYGADHTRADGSGKYMIVNGYPGGDMVIWRQTVTVQENTDYYFSAYAASLNQVSPYADLVFRVNGVNITGTNGGASTGSLGPKGDPYQTPSNLPDDWKRFYGKWNSGSATTAIIEIINLETATGGNDFGLDDISFGTLSTFFNKTAGNTDQTFCEEALLETIQYEYGGTGDPALTWKKDGSPITGNGNPDGVEEFYNGRDYLVRGVPTEPGFYEYTLSLEVCDNQTLTRTGSIDVKAQPTPGTFKNAVNNVVPVDFRSTPTIELENTAGTISDWKISIDGRANWNSLSNTTTEYEFPNAIERPVYLSAAAQQLDANNAVIRGCDTEVSDTILVAIRNVWGGQDKFEGQNAAAGIKSVTDDNWSTASNWSFDAVPSTGDYVIISDLGTNGIYPVLIASQTVQVPNLVLRDNSSITVPSTAKLQIANDVLQGTNKTGAIAAQSGTVEFNGSADQNIHTSIFKDTTLANLVVSNTGTNGLAFSIPAGGKSLGIIEDITFGNTTGKLTSTNGAITLKSTATHTAGIDELKGSNSVSGQFVVERYLNSEGHGKAWQLIATPADGQSILQSWMENKVTPPPTGYGIYLNGPGSNSWDWNGGQPSIKSWNTERAAYDGAANSGVQVYNNGKGWMTFVRGDRSVTEVNQDANATTLRSRGTLKTGDVSFSIPAKVDGYFSIGNPYPTTVDLSKLVGHDGQSGTIFYIWNPNLNGELALGLGGFEAYTKVGSDMVGPNDKTNNFIFSGQAFFVQTNDDNAGSLIFKESDKALSATQTLINFRQGDVEANEFSASVMRVNVYQNGNRLDGTMQILDKSFNNEVDMSDGRKLFNSGVSLSMKAEDNTLLVIERRKPFVNRDTVNYQLSGAAKGSYTFRFNSDNLHMNGMNAWLIDNFNGTSTPVNLAGETEIPFDITADAASTAANRFKLVFEGIRVPELTFENVAAVKDGGSVDVNWNVKDEYNVDHYVVMASTDGNNFTDLATVQSSGEAAYSTLDRTPVTGYNFYKIRAISADGGVLVSSTTNVFFGKGKPQISVFPNPVTGGAVNLMLENQPAGKYRVRLLSNNGQWIDSRTIEHFGGSIIERIPWKNELSLGSYRFEITRPDGKVETVQVVY